MTEKIGIIGGAGPMASCLLYKFIIEECQQKFGCRNDSDFPEIILINYPFSSMLNTKDSEKNRSKIEAELQLCIDKLKNVGVGIVVIACTTLHSFLKNVNFKGMQFLNIVQETFNDAKRYKLKKLFVLATSTTIANKIYNNDLEVVFVNEEVQKVIDEIIERILAGSLTNQDSQLLKIIIEKTEKKEHFDGVVLGCTDLSVLQTEYPTALKKDVLFLDSLRILSEKIVLEIFRR